MSSKPEREANLFMAELLVTDDSIMELMKMGYCYEFIASEIGIPVQVVDFKGQIMRKKDVGASIDFLFFEILLLIIS